jgi:coproporphyrinogen III oxidase
VPDDRHRVERFAGEVRTDLSFGDRMERYCRALGVRICREIEAARGGRFVPAVSDEGHERLVLEGASGGANAWVDVSAAQGSVGEAGLALRVSTDSPAEGSFQARLTYLPASRRFEGDVHIEPAADFGDAFYALWREVCRRHDVADFDAFRHAFDAARRPRAAGLAFAREDGSGLPADEYTFLFVRDAGRALLAAAMPLLVERP